MAKRKKAMTRGAAKAERHANIGPRAAIRQGPEEREASSCRHPKRLLRPASYSVAELSWRCRCGGFVRRATTPDERRKIRASQRALVKGPMPIHELSHAMQRHLRRPTPRLEVPAWVRLAALQKNDTTKTFKRAMRFLRITRKAWEQHKRWHGLMVGKRSRRRPNLLELARIRRDPGIFEGYEAMERVNEFARSNPDVLVCGVDDDHHAGSMVALVPHKERGKRYWGTTVLYIPQCTGEKPIRLFLYPDHLDGLVKALSSLQKEQRKLKKAERRLERQSLARMRREGKDWDWQ